MINSDKDRYTLRLVMRKTRFTRFAFLLGLLMLVVEMPNAIAATKIHNNIQIRGYHGKCLDVRGPSSRNGTPVQLWECVNVPQQRWDIYDNGEIRSRLDTRKCLDLRGPYDQNGADVQIWDCVGVPNQLWTVDIQLHRDAGRNEKPNEIRSRWNNRCLDVRGASSANGTAIQMWSCVGVPNQKFSLGKTQLRNNFSLSHLNGVPTNVPVSCWTVTDGNHLCRTVEGHDTRTFYTFANSNTIDEGSHPIHGKQVTTASGNVYEGCSLRNNDHYACDYKTYDAFDKQTFEDDGWVMRVFWDWARYTGDQAGCAAALSGMWSGRSTATKRTAWALLLAACDHGPYQR